jgi:hypothetical protein
MWNASRCGRRSCDGPRRGSGRANKRFLAPFLGRLESFVRARNAWSQRRELRLKVLTHNVMILLRVEVFYTATPVPFTYSFLLLHRVYRDS